MKDINLLQGYQQSKKQFDLKKSSRKVLTVFLILCVLFAADYFGMILLEHLFQSQATQAQQEAAAYSEVVDVKNATAQKQTQITNIEELLSTASGTSYVDTDFLWTLCSTLNENLFFSTVSLNENGTVAISGKSATRPDITYFVYTLKQTDLFSDVSFNMVNTETSEDAAADTYDFTITGTLRGGVDGE